MEGILVVLAGVAACVGAPLFLLFVFASIGRARKTAESGFAEVQAGPLHDLAPWPARGACMLARQWRGTMYWNRGAMGNACKASGRAYAAGIGPVLGLALQGDHRASSGTLLARTASRSLELRMDGNTAWVRIDGRPFGTIGLRDGTLRRPNGAPAGRYMRDPGHDIWFAGFQVGGREAAARLEIGGRQLAVLDTRVVVSHDPPGRLEPLVLSSSSRSQDDELWLLAVCALELGWHGVLTAVSRHYSRRHGYFG